MIVENYRNYYFIIGFLYLLFFIVFFLEILINIKLYYIYKYNYYLNNVIL